VPALDRCHLQVVRALEKVGWRVSKKPFTLDLPTRQLYVDILAEQTNEEIEEWIE